ncbi:MAG: biotin/lipoyl-containing protein [Bacillota bacterium]|nr:biotin/lipoyl-containing protein [Bacillota bacterium]
MKYCVTINGKRYEVEVEKGSAAIVSTSEVAFTEDKKEADTKTTPEVAASKTIEAPQPTAETGTVEGKEVVKAPMAGGITDIKVYVGSSVKKGDTLLLLEAMKMENEITAHVDGIVAEIRTAKGSSVSAGDVLMMLR